MNARVPIIHDIAHQSQVKQFRTLSRDFFMLKRTDFDYLAGFALLRWQKIAS
jgi:hypothetical protein